MDVPLLDLKAQYETIRGEIQTAVNKVFESQVFILGPKVRECEEAIARYCACDHGIGVSSGTDALLVCLMAEDVGPGDEVITTSYSFFATGGCISRTGATPVFVDVDPVTYNIAPGQVKAKITKKTKAIIPVHLYGQVADMDPILEISESHGLVVIEDAAQAIGAEYKGKRAGSIGHYGCFSFFPSKNLGVAGDGGMVTTNDAGRAEKIRVLRGHGSQPKYYHKLVGGNFRLDALQAAVALVKLRRLDGWTAARQANAARYERLLSEAGLVDKGAVVPPRVVTNRHVFNQYVLRVSRRDDLRSFLQKKGVGTEVYYPVPLHLQECFLNLGYGEGSLPESENAARDTVAIPVFPELRETQARYVVDCIREFYERG